MPRKRTTAQVPPEPPLSEFDYSKSFQRFSLPDEFARFCAGFPNPQGAVTYIYRLKPKIDREQMGNRETTIEKVAGETVDYDYLARKWQSGKYMCLFNDLSRPRDLQQVAKCTIEVDDPTLPPILDPGELVICDQNSALISKYLNTGFVIVDNTNELKPAGFKQLVAQAGNSAEKTLADTVSQLATQMAATNSAAAAVPPGAVVIDRDMLRDLMRKGPDELDRAFAIADRLRPAEDKTTQALLDRLVGVLLSREKNPVAMPAMTVDPMSQLDKMADVMTKFGWSAPGSGGAAAPGEGGGFLSSGLTALIGPALNQFALGLGQGLAMKFNLPMPEAAPSAAASTVVSLPTAAPQPPVVASTQTTAAPIVTEEDPMKALISVGRAAIAAFESGEGGDDFAERLCANERDEQIYYELLGMGKTQILSALAMVPGLNEKLAPKRAEYEAWLDDFIAYGTPEGGPVPA